MPAHGPIVIGLDIGTSACKAVALAVDGSVRGSGEGAYPTAAPAPGQAVQQAAEVLAGVTAALRQVAGRIDPRHIAGISLSGAMHTLLPMDERHRPLAPALTFADGRAGEQARALREQPDAAELYQHTGCPLQAIYHPARLRWFREQQPELVANVRLWVGLKQCAGHLLTGMWAMDHGWASTTGLLDLRTLDWHKPALRAAGITADHLPPLLAPTAALGRLSAKTAGVLGLPAGLPVIAGGSDGPLANLGAGAVLPGTPVVTVGTSGAVRFLTDRPLLDPRQRTWCYLLLPPAHHVAGGAINNGGLVWQWVRRHAYGELTDDDAYPRMAADAAAVAPGADGLLLLPYFTGERTPLWREDARAAVLGLTLRHTRAHLARAALEAVAFCLADVWRALPLAESGRVVESEGSEETGEPAGSGGSCPPVRLTGGMAAVAPFPAILADVLGAPVQPVTIADASAVGAAMLGHLALGHVSDLTRISPPVQEDAAVQPDPRRRAFYQRQFARFRAAQKLALTLGG